MQGRAVGIDVLPRAVPGRIGEGMKPDRARGLLEHRAREMLLERRVRVVVRARALEGIAALADLAANVARPARRPEHPLRLVEVRSEEHTSELQSREKLVCRLLLEKKKTVKPLL